MDLFELVAKLTLDTSEYDAAVRSAEANGRGMGSGAVAAGNLISSAVKAAAKAVVGFGKDAIQAGMDFDKSMSQVAATLGYTTEQLNDTNSEQYKTFQRLRDFAQEQGRTTQYTATQAADALNYMALAGYNADQSIAMLPAVLSLAAAGNMELATASDMVTDAQTAFGLTTEETFAMVDQMAKTASSSNTSVSQLGSAFLTVGANAQYMSGGTSELSTVLGIMADNGIKGSEAGTHLRNMLLKLASPTKDGAAALDAMGVSIFDTDGKMRSLRDIFLDFNEATKNMTEEDRIKTFSELFNVRDMAAANALLKTSAERWDELGAKIDQSAGAAKAMADTQLDNLQGDVTLLQSAFEGLMIAVSDEVTPNIREGVQAISSGVSQITKAFKDGGLEAALEELVRLVFGLESSEQAAETLDLIVSAIKALAITLTTYAVGKEIGAIMTALQTGGSGSIGIVLAAIAAALTLIINNWDKIEPVLATVGDFLQRNIVEPLQAVIDWIREAVFAVGEFLGFDMASKDKQMAGKRIAREVQNTKFYEDEEGGIYSPELAKKYGEDAADMMSAYYFDAQRKLAANAQKNANNQRLKDAVDEEIYNELYERLADLSGYSEGLQDLVVAQAETASDTANTATQDINDLAAAAAAAAGDYNINFTLTTTGNAPDPDGEHAIGAGYIPYDNYLAQLHRGEMVLTRQQANAYRSGEGGGVGGLAAIVESAITRGMERAHIAMSLDGAEVARNTNRRQADDIAARRFAPA